jgi:hypothetical protein
LIVEEAVDAGAEAAEAMGDSERVSSSRALLEAMALQPVQGRTDPLGEEEARRIRGLSYTV